MSVLRNAMGHAVLGWVKPELDATLRQAREDLEAYAGDPGDGGAIGRCAAHLHQVRGTLHMVELYAPAMVAEELERLADALGTGAVAEHEEACATLLRGMVLLPDYLERLQSGHRDIPIVLLPLLNDIRTMRGAEPLGEHVLFAAGAEAPSEAELDHARSSLGGRNRALLGTVGEVVKEDLLRVKEALDLHLRTGGDAAALQPQAVALTHVADTLGMMDLGAARNVVLAQRDRLRDIAEGRQPASETALLEIAGALLYVDASLDDQVARLGAPAGAGAPEPTVAETLHLVEALAGEAIVNFAAAREGFIAFIETGWDHERLAEVPRLLGEVSGALRMLELPVAAGYLEGVRRYVAVELVERRRVPGGRQLDTLADAVASLEYYLEALREDRPNRDEILEIARSSLEELRYWPLPERADATAGDFPDAQADDAALAPIAGPVPPGEMSPEGFQPEAPSPAESGPREVPREVPLEGIPFDGAPAEAISLDEAPSEEVPSNAAPSGEVPSEEVPSEGIPSGEVASGEIPSDGGPSGEIEPPEIAGDGIAVDEVAYAEPAAGQAPAAGTPAPVAAAGPAPAPARIGFDPAAGIDDDIREVFLEELAEETEHLVRLLPGWRGKPDDPERLRPIRRIFHTLKGSGRLVGAGALGEFAWAVERMLNAVLEGRRPASPAVVALVAQASEALPSVHAALCGQDVAVADIAGLAGTADRVAAGEEVPHDFGSAGAGPAQSAPAVDSPGALATSASGAGTDADADAAQATAAAGQAASAFEGEGTPARVDSVLLEILQAEVDQHLRHVDAWLAAEDAPRPVDEPLLRALHTMNGAFAMADVPEITFVTAAAERYARRLQRTQTAAPDEGVAALAAAATAIRRCMATLSGPAPRIPSLAAPAARLQALQDALPEPGPVTATVDDAAGHMDAAVPMPADGTSGAEMAPPGPAADDAFAEATHPTVDTVYPADIAGVAENTGSTDGVENIELAEDSEDAADIADADVIAADVDTSEDEAEAAGTGTGTGTGTDTDTDTGTDTEPESESESESEPAPHPGATAAASEAAGADHELVDIFIEEGSDLLDHADGLLDRLRRQADDHEAVIGLQRDLHTLKGGARMAGADAIGDLGHAIESLLEAIAGGRTGLAADDLQLLARGFDRLHGLLGEVRARRAAPVPAALVAEFEARTRHRPAAPAAAGAARPVPAPLSAPLPLEQGGDGAVPQTPQEQVRVRADLLDRLVNRAGEVAIYRSRLEQLLGTFRGAMAELDRTNARLRDQLRRLDLETEAQIVARYRREQDAGDHGFDPLELDRFSTLQQLSRGLAESAADLAGLQEALDDLARQHDSLLQQQSRVSTELQEGLMRTRMVPFDGLVPRLRRLLRQAAGETGKQAQLQVEGTHGELDRSVLERMVAPLEHMLRNSVAHGLETPAARRAAGKPEEGVVRIALRREGSEIVLEVSDDGAGLDRVAIRRRAEARGLTQPDAVLSEADLDALIFESGFSTSDQVSQLAGRGVGMDVVRNEARQLGGTVEVMSMPGQGTVFTLRLPQTLAVTQAVFVQVGEAVYAVPVASVGGVGRTARARLGEADAAYRYGGEEFAVHDLGVLVGQPHARADGTAQAPLLLVRSGDLRAAVAVDQVLGNREIVVKPVGPQIASVPGIYGATITGDGRVVVILDVAPLVRRHLLQPPQAAAPAPAAAPRPMPLVLVVDDSLTMRKVTGRVLERHGFEVQTARDGIEALERMEERVPDLVLLDVEMPRMDGYELASAMKAVPRLGSVPIIMITSRTGDKHRQRALDIGVERYLGKPYQEPDLMRNVYDLLGAARDAR